MRKVLSLLCAGAVMTVAQGQWFTTGNLSTNPGTNYLGTQDNQALMLRTNAIQRMRLNANQSYTIGTFTSQVANGYLGLSPDNSLWSTGPGPFSRLHLHDGSAAYPLSYRSWMRNGVTYTTNLDHMYFRTRSPVASAPR